jgi:beta-lysine 5,6-aminomutase beta subunit
MADSSSTPQLLRAYGDRRDDGRVQLSFTLPVAPSARAKEAARRYAERLGLKNVFVATMEQAGASFCFFVVYGSSEIAIDFSVIDVPEVTVPKWGFKEINSIIKGQLHRKVVVVGACTGSDAHTVGIDAIMNMKGFAGDKGLEAYPWFDAYNLGAQVDNAALLARAREVGADAILVSQIMTQRDLHIDNSKELIHLVGKTWMRGEADRPLLLLGGPRIDHKLARELGFDAGFGPGTSPSQVASFVVDALVRRSGLEPDPTLAH